MKRSRLSWSRFILGVILVAVAVLMFLFTDLPSAGAIAIGVLGLVSIAISRRK
jgi:hypothetical protein